jgi:hypothetical protein
MSIIIDNLYSNNKYYKKYIKYKEKYIRLKTDIFGLDSLESKEEYLGLKNQIYGVGSLESKEKYLALKNDTELLQIGGRKKSNKNKNKIQQVNSINSINSINSEVKWKINFNTYYVGLCKMNKEEKEIIKKNPHCAEFFCKISNILNCTECSNYLFNNNLFKTNPFLGQQERSESYKQINKPTLDKNKCKNRCLDGYLYDFITKNFNLCNSDINSEKTELDKHKILENFYNDKFIYNYDEIPNLIKFEDANPRPKSVVHWGQLKLFLVTLYFLVKYIEESDEKVHIIYAGSAVGHNILILSDMFPNIKWYLIDPAQFVKELYTHKQVVEIRNEFFTDELAKYYNNLLKSRDKNNEKLFFISDIRLEPSDDCVMEDNESDIRWHKIIKPDYSYLKFRCPYEGNKLYDYYDGEISIQPYAPAGSTE